MPIGFSLKCSITWKATTCNAAKMRMRSKLFERLSKSPMLYQVTVRAEGLVISLGIQHGLRLLLDKWYPSQKDSRRLVAIDRFGLNQQGYSSPTVETWSPHKETLCRSQGRKDDRTRRNFRCTGLASERNRIRYRLKSRLSRPVHTFQPNRCLSPC